MATHSGCCDYEEQRRLKTIIFLCDALFSAVGEYAPSDIKTHVPFWLEKAWFSEPAANRQIDRTKLHTHSYTQHSFNCPVSWGSRIHRLHTSAEE